jgi:hypothetical protein
VQIDANFSGEGGIASHSLIHFGSIFYENLENGVLKCPLERTYAKSQVENTKYLGTTKGSL